MATAFFAPTETVVKSKVPAAAHRGFWRRALDRLIAARAAEAELQMARYRHSARFNAESPVLKQALGPLG